MTNPAPEPILTAEHQAIADQLYDRIEVYQQSHYQPATGWPRSALSSSVRSSLSKADQSAPAEHYHSVDDLEGFDEFISNTLTNYSRSGHRHGIADLDNLSSSPNSNTIVRRNNQGDFEVNEPSSPSQPASKRYVDQRLTSKSNTVHSHVISDVGGLQTVLDSKSAAGHSHSIDDVHGLRAILNSGGGGGTIDPEVLLSKADLVNGTVPTAQLPTLPVSKIQDLASELAVRPTLVEGKLNKNTLPTLNPSDITGLSDFMSSQSDTVKLVDGLVPTNNLPRSVFQRVVRVSSQLEMVSLTTDQVKDGDVAVVSGGAEAGTYQLLGAPSQISSWVKYVHNDLVKSVNGKNGVVALTASDVGARPSGPVPLQDVTGLQSSLDEKLSAGTLNTALTPYAKTTDINAVRADLASQNYSYASVDYVATSRVTSLSGQQSIDGDLVPAGRRVLLTAQSSSAQNGIWVVSSTAWYRDTAMPEGSVVTRGSLVAVKSGSENANTLWRMSNNTPSQVGTDSQNWVVTLKAGGGGVNFTPGNGLVLNGSTLSVRAGNNITVSAAGVSLDTTGLMRKFAGDVPSGSAVATVTHNLNTRDVYVSLYEVGTGEQVLAGVSVTGVNTVAVEFATAPGAGQYRAVVFG